MMLISLVYVCILVSVLLEWWHSSTIIISDGNTHSDDIIMSPSKIDIFILELSILECYDDLVRIVVVYI